MEEKQLLSIEAAEKLKIVPKTVERRLLTIKELSEYTGMSVHTLYEWVHLRKVPFVKFGRSVRFDLKDIDRFIEKLKVDEQEN